MDREMLGPAWEMWRREKNASFLVILAIKFESSWSDHGKPLAGLNEFMSFKLFYSLMCSFTVAFFLSFSLILQVSIHTSSNYLYKPFLQHLGKLGWG